MRIKELILDCQYWSFIRVVFSLIFFLKKSWIQTVYSTLQHKYVAGKTAAKAVSDLGYH